MKQREFIKNTLLDNADLFAIYLLGETHDEETNTHWFKDYFSYEFVEYVGYLTSSIQELLTNMQYKLTIDNLLFMIDYEAISFTCREHSHKNEREMRSFLEELLKTLEI